MIIPDKPFIFMWFNSSRKEIEDPFNGGGITKQNTDSYYLCCFFKNCLRVFENTFKKFVYLFLFFSFSLHLFHAFRPYIYICIECNWIFKEHTVYINTKLRKKNYRNDGIIKCGLNFRDYLRNAVLQMFRFCK